MPNPRFEVVKSITSSRFSISSIIQPVQQLFAILNLFAFIVKSPNPEYFNQHNTINSSLIFFSMLSSVLTTNDEHVSEMTNKE